jgi:Cd2+/Zn2+-exporting ATPase
MFRSTFFAPSDLIDWIRSEHRSSALRPRARKRPAAAPHKDAPLRQDHDPDHHPNHDHENGHGGHPPHQDEDDHDHDHDEHPHGHHDHEDHPDHVQKKQDLRGQHDLHESELKGHLLFVFGAAVCLIIGAIIGYVHPDQPEVAGLWSMAGAILGAIPVLLETLEGVRSKAAENSEFYINQFISLAILACFVTGQYATAGIVAIILMVGHVFEDRSMLGVNEAINSLLNLSRGKARRLRPDGGEEEVDSETLHAGDKIRLRPGDIIPADGKVLAGSSTINQANITGESLPIEATVDTPVFAGTTNLTGLLEVLVLQAGDDTVLGRVKKIVEEAQSTRAPIVRLTEQYAQYYLPLILLLAGFVLFFTHDIMRSIAVIIASIPCSFILAGPTAMVAALATASRLGILVKSVLFFEAAADIDTVVFDKTGTLTTGCLRVVEVTPHPPGDRNRLLALAAALESGSTHPMAQAVVQAAKAAGVAVMQAEQIAEDHGLGMSGRVGDQHVMIGRANWLQGKGVVLGGTADTFPQYSAIHVAGPEGHLGTIYLSDTTRPEARPTLEELRRLGLERQVMLTGDRLGVARAVAEDIGFTEYRADCLPEQKREAVEQLKRDGNHVLVVGDGVNDAPALAAGNLSMAMGALGSDVAIQTADIALMSNDLARVAQFLQLSRKTIHIINQNIFCAILFSVLGIVAASEGFISPMIASFVHEIGAFFVIFNSARLLKFETAAPQIAPGSQTPEIQPPTPLHAT